MGPLRAGSSEALHQALTHRGNTYQTEHPKEWCQMKMEYPLFGTYMIENLVHSGMPY